MEYHIPVLLDEVIEGLNIRSGKKYIDATLGGGGHTFEILRLGGIVLGIDVDQDALDFVEEKVKSQKLKVKNLGTVTTVRGNFRDIEAIAKEHGFERVDGVLFDFGVSSHQIESKGRGFSFQKDEVLDMRMDKSLSIKALDLLHALNKGELERILKGFGEVINAGKLAGVIVEKRKNQRITTTGQLVSVIGKASGIYDLTRNKKLQAKLCAPVFQAIRIAVNNELENIELALEQAIRLLGAQGRLACISFHSLEDRLVKQAFENWQEYGNGRIITKKPIMAMDAEISKNPRSRSAKLRVFEHI